MDFYFTTMRRIYITIPFQDCGIYFTSLYNVYIIRNVQNCLDIDASKGFQVFSEDVIINTFESILNNSSLNNSSIGTRLRSFTSI